MCCSPWDHKESDMTEQLNSNNTHRLLGQKKMDTKAAVQWISLAKLSTFEKAN